VEERTQTATDWLLASDEPAIALLARRDLLDEQADAKTAAAALLTGAKVTALLAGQQPDGGFGVSAYNKWTGAHWRLVSLVELGIPPHEPRAIAAAETVLTSFDPARRRISVINGLPRSHASVWGNALAVCCRLGLWAEPRVQAFAEALLAWQWPDGGWNCAVRATGYRSSFHESHAAAWGLHEYGLATGDAAARQAADRTAELFLEHRLFRSVRTGEVIRPGWLALRYPPYWHYDILQALVVLARMGKAADPRASEALDELERQRLPDGRWRPRGSWWNPPGSPVAPEVVDWGRSGPSEMLTLNALRVLRAAGRLT
jgi:hypothetical protein